MAQSTGKIRSNAIGVYVSNTTATDFPTIGNTYGDVAEENDSFELVACATSGTFTGSMEVLDATTKDNDGQREILTGGLTWSMSAEGLIQFDVTTDVKGAIDLFDLWTAKTRLRLSWTTGNDGDYMYYGNAYITSYEETAGLNEIASFSVTFEGDGSITKAIIDETNVNFLNNNN